MNDTRERKKREAVTETRRKRMLRKRSGSRRADHRDARDLMDDTRERKRRESVTATRQKRMRKKRSREGGSKSGVTATVIEGGEGEDI